MVQAGEIATFLLLLSLVLSMYTARLVCNDAKYDNLGSGMRFLRKYAGCAPLPQVQQQPKQPRDEKKKKDASSTDAAVVDTHADIPVWAKPVSRLERENWPVNNVEEGDKDVTHKLALLRSPRLVGNAPVNVFANLDALYTDSSSQTFWQSPAEMRTRAVDDALLFARESYFPDFQGVSFPSSDSNNKTSKYYDLTPGVNLHQFFQVGVDGRVVAVSEFALSKDDVAGFLQVPVDMFRVHSQNDPEEQGSSTSFENDTSVYTVRIESPTAVTPAMFSPAHQVQLQLAGKRKVLLFPPERFFDLMFYPLVNPRRRQSMLEFTGTKVGTKVPCIVAEVQPGDALYIPPFWTARTLTACANDQEFKPREFSYALTIMSVSEEQRVQMMVAEAARAEETLNVVSHMASAPEDFKDPEERFRAGLGVLVQSLFDYAGMDALVSLERLLVRYTSSAELQADMQTESSTVRECPRMHLLEAKAHNVVTELAQVLAESFSMLAKTYKDLDERYGVKSNRQQAVWRIVLDDLVERLIVSKEGGNVIKFIKCVLKQVKQEKQQSSREA